MNEVEYIKDRLEETERLLGLTGRRRWNWPSLL